eukprot:388699-Rhodomonas_salina.2
MSPVPYQRRRAHNHGWQRTVGRESGLLELCAAIVVVGSDDADGLESLSEAHVIREHPMQLPSHQNPSPCMSGPGDSSQIHDAGWEIKRKKRERERESGVDFGSRHLILEKERHPVDAWCRTE